MFSQNQRNEPRRKRGANKLFLRGAFVALSTLSITGFAIGSEAGAAVQSFNSSPSSGPIGTVVNVSGTACAPSAVSSTQNYVSVSSSTFPLTMNFPTAANGSWHGSFRVPANALPVPGLVDAVCFAGGAPSSTTVYTPRTFTVTSGGATAGPTAPPAGGAPGGSVTPPNGGAPGNGVGSPGNGSGSGAGNGTGSAGGNGGGSGSGAKLGGANGGGAGTPANVASGTKATAAQLAGAARAKRARAASNSAGKHHFPWWLLLLVLLVLALATIAALLFRRKHEHEVVQAPVTPATPITPVT